MFKSAGFSPLVAGFIAVVVGYAGPTVLAFEVARQIGMPEPHVISWFWAYSIASGVAGLFASWFWRVPVVLAWSTPGFGILAATLSGHSINEAVGAYIVVAGVTILLGFTGWFERLLKLVPPAIAAAVLAGVLFPFVVKVMGAVSLEPLLVGAMIAAFIIMRLLSPQWMIATVALVAVMGSVLMGGLDLSQISFQFAVPQLIAPEFKVSAILDIAVPLLLVTLTGQYVPGFAILKSNGFSPPADSLVRLCGFASLLSAPFGNHTVNPAAIIAGIAAGPDSHPDPAKRWPAGISAGVTYLVFGSFAGSFVALFAGLPKGLAAALAGLALLGTVTNSLSTALTQPEDRDAAIVTFAVAVSGFSALGMNAALWGLLAGLVLRWTRMAYQSARA